MRSLRSFSRNCCIYSIECITLKHKAPFIPTFSSDIHPQTTPFFFYFLDTNNYFSKIPTNDTSDFSTDGFKDFFLNSFRHYNRIILELVQELYTFYFRNHSKMSYLDPLKYNIYLETYSGCFLRYFCWCFFYDFPVNKTQKVLKILKYF